MNRYEKTAQLPSSSSASLGEHTVNLVRVRPGLTSSPQTSFTDFTLYPTSYGLEIKLPLNRVRGRLMATAAKAPSQDTELNLLPIIGMALFVGGSVILTGSAVFGVIVAIMLPALFWLVTLPEKAARNEQAKLRLVNTPNGRTLLSMSAVSDSQRDSKDVIYVSNLPVRLVSAKTTLRGGQVSFTVYVDNPRGNQICITGSRQEVRWLHARIVQWGRGSAT